jgi:predicted unusual protein kinase regulating ubiquinone biosynthesis (AarF/ABC1/UbiB family)
VTGTKDERYERLLARLKEDERRAVPSGLSRRLAGSARTMAGAGLGILRGGLLGRKGPGLAKADLETIEHLVSSLGELKGLAMKMGQILGTLEGSLPEEARTLLSILQTQSQPIGIDVITRQLRSELGARAEELLETLEPEPVSAASIGQVHRASLPDGTAVAVKVRHPAIEEAIRSDFQMASVGRAFVSLLPAGGGLTVAESIDEARARLLEECDYRLEAERQTTFRRIFATHPVLEVPRVHAAYSSRGVLTTTWEEGVGLDDYLRTEPSQERRNQAGAALFELYFGTLYRHALFHADPHPGNYLFQSDGRIVVLDYGCVRVYDRATVDALTSLAGAVRANDDDRIGDALLSLGARRPARGAERDAVRRLLNGFFGPILRDGPGPVDANVYLEMASVIRDKRLLIRLRLPGRLLFLFRIRFGLYSVLSRLGAICDWAALETSFTAD